MQKAVGGKQKRETRGLAQGKAGGLLRLPLCVFISAFCLLPPAHFFGQKPSPPASANSSTPGEDVPLPGDWAPELLDAILTSSNAEAREALYRAAFAAGPAIIPQLEAGLKDDRTAEFAAQTLVFIGGEKALQILWKLVSDPRDLDLRRFYYGALGEFDPPEPARALLDVISRADQEPDRTVTEAAIIALTVRSDAALVPRLRQAQSNVKDFVIRDDIDNALEVIARRARYLATSAGKQAGGSVEQAVRTYFMPALEQSEASDATAQEEPGPKSDGRVSNRTSPASAAASKSRAGQTVPTKSKQMTTLGVKVEIQNLTFSPDKSRALARVIFEDSVAIANYDIVLQKRYGNWTIASVWLGQEVEKTPPSTKQQSSQE